MGIEQYQILKNLGERGGMSDVFQGYNRQTGDQVVIKYMKVPENIISDHTMRERFEREIHIARTVDHPHILRAIDDGNAVHNGHTVPFLVYPYIKGGSLQSLSLRVAPWKYWRLPQIVDIIIQAAQGLHYLHTLTPAIVHHDVKPANFLLQEVQEQGPDRKVHLWLSDFGISRWQLEEAYQTQNIIGTPAYMAPEHLNGYISILSDQYALALVTCYLFTGVPPKASFVERNRRSIIELNPTLLKSQEIDYVLLQALSLEPAKRFPGVLDFAEALRIAVMRQLGQDGFHDGLTIPRPPLPETTELLPPHVPELVPHKEIPLMPVHSYQEVDKPLPAQNPVAHENRPSLKPLPVFSLQVLFSKAVSALPGMFSWSPDGTQFICTFYGQEPPLLLDISGKVQALQALTSANLVSWSPDGRLLAVCMQNQGPGMSKVCLWDREKPLEQPITLCIHSTPTIEGLDWSSRGQLAVWVQSHILLYTLPMHTTSFHFPYIPRTLVLEQPYLCGDLGTLRWSPDGLWLAAGTIDGALICWRAGNDLPSLHIPASGARIHSLAWSDDSVWLAVAFQNKRVGIWNMRELRQVQVWEKLPRMPQMLSILPREHILVVATRRDLLLGGLNATAPMAQYPGQTLAAWSPTGRKLATLDPQNDTTIVVLQR